MSNPTTWIGTSRQASEWGVRPGIILNPPRLVLEAGTVLAFVVSILVANYALAAFPNVKPFDLMVFVAGYSLGFRRGVTVAVVAWLVYGNFNPYGSSGMPLLLVLMASETVYAGAGAMLRRVIAPDNVRALPSQSSLVFGGAAIVCTLAYDVVTNLYTGISWAYMTQSTDYSRWIFIALTNPGALFFTAAHLSSNFLFFTAFAPVLIKMLKRLSPGDAR